MFHSAFSLRMVFRGSHVVYVRIFGCFVVSSRFSVSSFGFSCGLSSSIFCVFAFFCGLCFFFLRFVSFFLLFLWFFSVFLRCFFGLCLRFLFAIASFIDENVNVIFNYKICAGSKIFLLF